MMDKKMYEYFQRRLGEGLQVKEVQRLSDEWLNSSVQGYLQGHYKQVQEEVEKGKRFQRLLKKAVMDPVSYVVGIFSGILYAMELLTSFTKQRTDFFKEAEALFEKANVERIANYLSKHPDSQHKVICTELGINKGYLSQLLREMERTGLVERYAAGKRSFYSLTLYGQKFVKKERSRKNVTNSFGMICLPNSLEEKYAPLYTIAPLEKRQERQKYTWEIRNIHSERSFRILNKEGGECVAKC